MVQETTLIINLSALEHNFLLLKSQLNAKTRFLAVVKAFGYGSEAIAVAKRLESLGVDYFAVAYVKEGVALRESGIKTPILVLHPQPLNFNTAIEYCLEPSLYSFNVLQKFSEIAQNRGVKDYPIHLKFNTGLNRLGFEVDDVQKITSLLSSYNTSRVVSLFSHLSASEDLEEKEFTDRQIIKFETITRSFSTFYGSQPIRHLCNTSGVLNFPNAELDMVRCGIGLYGFDNTEDHCLGLKSVISLKTTISQIHKINVGDSVGYNRAYIASSPMRIATLPIGHADGIGRQYGNGVGFVTIKGCQAKIVGNVCMDMVMVDVTNISCREGDEVVIFDSSTTVEHLAKNAGTISYEVLTAISQRVKRKIID